MNGGRNTGPGRMRALWSIFRNHWLRIAACLPALMTATGAVGFRVRGLEQI